MRYFICSIFIYFARRLRRQYPLLYHFYVRVRGRETSLHLSPAPIKHTRRAYPRERERESICRTGTRCWSSSSRARRGPVDETRSRAHSEGSNSCRLRHSRGISYFPICWPKSCMCVCVCVHHRERDTRENKKLSLSLCYWMISYTVTFNPSVRVSPFSLNILAPSNYIL